MTTKSKKINPAWLLLPVILAMLIYAANRFLNTSSTYSSYTKTYTITGWEAVALVPHFWLLVWVGIILCLLFLLLAYVNETGAWFGKNWRGELGLSILFVALAITVLCLPWLRGTEAKSDGGATLPKKSSYERNSHLPVDTYRSGFTYLTDGILPKGHNYAKQYCAGQFAEEMVARGWGFHTHMDGSVHFTVVGSCLRPAHLGTHLVLSGWSS
jgi:hypothetical protein